MAPCGTHGFTFEIDEVLSEGSLLGLTVTMPTGAVVELWAEVELRDRTAILSQFAIYAVPASGPGPRPALLRKMALAAMEEFDVDCIRIEEALRTTGPRTGRTVERITFSRAAKAAVS
jgi:hypothetical protein